MTVKQYQKVNEVSNAIYLDNVDKVAFTVCHLLGYTEQEVDVMPPKKFVKLMNRTVKMVERTGAPLPFAKKLNTNARKITLGQFIEINYWLKSGVVESVHLIAATMIHDENHSATADRVLKMNARRVVPYVSEFIESFEALIASYPGLFPPPKEVEPGEEKPMPEKPHPFLEQYGWVFSATQVADFEGVTLSQAYDLPVIQALNAMAYLKSKAAYDEKLAKQK